MAHDSCPFIAGMLVPLLRTSAGSGSGVVTNGSTPTRKAQIRPGKVPQRSGNLNCLSEPPGDPGDVDHERRGCREEVASSSRVGPGQDRGFNRGGPERVHKGEAALCRSWMIKVDDWLMQLETPEANLAIN